MVKQYTLPEIEPVAASHAASEAFGAQQASLRIYTLGRFSLVRNGEPLRHARKAPGKPLALLKALIAMGGRQVGAANLASILWPDKEGDLAQQAFETTLHRLRKHLGDDSYLLLEDGHLTLNSERVWVDVWEFERHLTLLRLAISHDNPCGCHADVHLYAERTMRLYQGHFLGRDDATCWSVSLQERLRNKYIHCMIALGAFWEQHGLPGHAILCYQKGIEVDDLIETFYQRLMICLDQTGRQPEAVATYRQCRHILSVVLGLTPMKETRDIYQNILSHYQQLAG
jgi:LuxR family maltose regulon positive regulatory protein